MTEREVKEFLEKNPVLVAGTLIAVGLAVLREPEDTRPDIPGLGGRHNAAWRGKGSYGKGPFGPQMGHRRG